MITFQGTYITDLPIKENNTLQNGKSNLVKLDYNNPEDVKALKDGIDAWNTPMFIADGVVFDMEVSSNLKSKFGNNENIDVYIATGQTNNFEKIDPEQIQGVIETVKSDYRPREIVNFEVAPKFAHYNKSRKISGIGHAILDAIKKLYPEDIKVNSLPEARDFYTNEDFEYIPCSHSFLYKHK